MKYTKFEDLPIWKSAIRITKLVYDLTANAKWSRDYGLKDQTRRAIVSISSNIVEGFEKNNNNEFMRFLRIAKGSAGEARNQLCIAYNLNYITETEYKTTNSQLEKLANDIGGFIVYLENYKKKQSAIRNPQ